MGEEAKFSDISAKLGLTPLESPAIIKKGEGSIQIGVPKEDSFQEKRTALTPRSVALLTSKAMRSSYKVALVRAQDSVIMNILNRELR